MDDSRSAAPCLDAVVIEEIRALSESGEDVLSEVVGLFMTHAPVQVAQLDEAITARDVALAARLAHRLKGTALGLGARRMASVCAAMELAADEQAVERLESFSPELSSVFASTCD